MSIRSFSATLCELESFLQPDEKARASQFFHVADRRRSLVARASLRKLLSMYLDVTAPENIAISLTTHGKPELSNSSIRFNASHSGDFVYLAFANNRRVGVDVEHVRKELDFEEIGRFCFSEKERAAMRKELDESSGFFQHWTAKESWMKADGRGLSLPITEYTLGRHADTPDRYGVLHEGYGELNWTTQTLPCPTGYFAAITAEGRDWSIETHSIADLIW